MGRGEMRCRRRGALAPMVERLRLERLAAFVATGEVGKHRVDPGAIESLHDFHGQPPQLVRLVEQRGQHQHACGALAAEG